MRVFDFNASVAAVTAYDDLEGSVISAGTFPGDFTGDVLSSNVLDGVVQPRGVTQAVSMQLSVAGTVIAQTNLMDEISVERDYDNIVQPWGFATPLTTPGGIFGTPLACSGPGMGKKSVDIAGVYHFPDGSVVTVPLIHNGIVDNSNREAGEGGLVEVFQGVDGAGRVDAKKITKQFPPGHGLPRGRVGREIMRQLGETRVSFEDGHRMDKELQLVGALPLGPLAEIFEVENRKVFMDSDGYWVNPVVGKVRTDESIRFSFEERDVLRVATVQQQVPQNVITLIIANGTRQKTMDACGITSEVETEYTVSTPYTMQRSLYRQNADRTYTSLTPHSPLTTPVLTKKVETTRIYRCETLIEEIVKTWALTRREVPRHVWEGGLGTDPELEDGWRSLVVYTDDNDGVGSGPAYYDDTETFLQTEIAHTKIFFLHQDYAHYTWAGLDHTWGQKIRIPYDGVYATGVWNESAPTYGQVQGSVTFVSRLGHVEGAIKARVGGPGTGFPALQWNEIEPGEGFEPGFIAKIWGNGAGNHYTNGGPYGGFLFEEGTSVPGEIDQLIPWSISVDAYSGDDKQFLVEKGLYLWEWRAMQGSGFYWGENDTRAEAGMSFRMIETTITTYPAKGNTHDEVVSLTHVLTGKNTTVSTKGISGHGPAIDRLDAVPVDETLYEDGEAVEFAKETRRMDTEKIIVTMPFDFFLTCHLPNEITVDFAWAENEEELKAMCEALASESAAQAIFFTLPANYLIREAMPIHFLYRPLAIDHNLRVKRVRWGMSPGQPILTAIEARLYPV